jgi:hypothetical protein
MDTSSAAGMPTGHRDPQVKGAKVKVALNKKGEPRKRLPKRPIEQLDGGTLQKQSTIYLKERNAAMRLRRMREGMQLARERELLIERELVIKQFSFLAIEIRQKLLTLPQRIGARLRARDPELAREVARQAKEVVHETLHTLARLPECVEPGWMERLEESGSG